MRTKVMLLASVVAAIPALLGAWSGTGGHAQVAGQWNLNVKGPAAHGDMAATMELQQDGKKVTGNFAAHGNEHTLAGELADGTLTLATTDTPADQGIEFNAKLKDDGTLAGYLSGPMGDMQWTASRAKAGQ
ncbi:MAG: hypothetical protein H0W08_24040 [Acidobacteria bacterium]|nr:hypothetical protein [Acidobacteriota bacterium]